MVFRGKRMFKQYLALFLSLFMLAACSSEGSDYSFDDKETPFFAIQSSLKAPNGDTYIVAQTKSFKHTTPHIYCLSHVTHKWQRLDHTVDLSPSELINALAIDDKGVLYIAWGSKESTHLGDIGGVKTFANGKWQDFGRMFKANGVTALVIKKNMIYAGTGSEGKGYMDRGMVYSTSLKDRKWQPFAGHFPDKHGTRTVTALQISHSGDVYATLDDGVIYKSHAGEGWFSLAAEDEIKQ